MPKRKKRKPHRKKRKPPQREKKRKERCYYDACALDYDKGTYSYIINERYYVESMASYLSLGEAYGNCYKKGEEKLKAFTKLMEESRDLIKIISNDYIEEQLEMVRKKFKRLTITDAVHLATALKHRCKIFRTIDPDIYKLDPEKVKELAKECNVPKFSIEKVEIKK